MVVSIKQRLTIIHYNIALWKCAFWLANTLDPFARGLHAHISLFICTFLTFQGTRFSRFSPGQQMTKRKEKNVLPQNKNKPRSKCRSVVSRSTRFRKWRIRRWRIIRACFWNLLSCSSTFFAPIINFFSYWLLIHPERKLKLLRFLERFMTTKWIGFECVTTVIECKQNAVELKSRRRINDLWGLWRFGGLLTRALFYILLHFLGKWILKWQTLIFLN